MDATGAVTVVILSFLPDDVTYSKALKKEHINKVFFLLSTGSCVLGETGALWTTGHHEHLSLWQSTLSNFDNVAL